MSHELLYLTLQLSSISSAAATQVCPKLSQYVSQRPPYSPVKTRAAHPRQVTPPSIDGQELKSAQTEGSGSGPASCEVVDGENAQVQSMSDVPAISMSHELLYLTLQLSSISSAAATQVCPKLSQYVSQRPPYSPVKTRAVHPRQVTPPSIDGQ